MAILKMFVLSRDIHRKFKSVRYWIFQTLAVKGKNNFICALFYITSVMITKNGCFGQSYSNNVNFKKFVVSNIFFFFKEDKTKDFGEIVEVPLSKEFQTAFTSIENRIRPVLVQLQEMGCIPPIYTTTNLTADFTRFILKQEEKKRVDEPYTNYTQNNKKYMFVYLHTLVTATELLKECELAVARGNCYLRFITKHN